jgi:hypothetical protein
VNSPKRRVEFLHHFAKRQGERRPPPDQHVIVAGAEPPDPGGLRRTLRRGSGGRQSHHLPQSAAYAVALHGVAHLSRYGKSDPNRPIVAALTRLQHEGPCRRPRAAGGGTKIAPPSQPLHDNDGTGVSITH